MKIIRGKSLFGLIYACLLAFPLISIVSRVIYVQSNKNAYQSYSGTVSSSYTTYEKDALYETNELSSYDDLVENNIYHCTELNLNQDTGLDIELIILQSESWSYTYDNILLNEFYANEVNISDSGIYVHTYFDNNDYNMDLVYYMGDSGSDILCIGIDLTINNVDFMYVTCDDAEIFYLSNSPTASSFNQYEYIEETVIVESTTLDNVFEYSIDKTISDSNFGKINFLSWFSDLFLDNNEVNNRYTHYANWYMNYIMFVSCAYLLFLVLMWFINFARKVLDRGMNYDW